VSVETAARSDSATDLLARIPASSRVVLEAGPGPALVVDRYLAANPTSRVIVVQPGKAPARPSAVALEIRGALADPGTLQALDDARQGEALDAVVLRAFHRLPDPLKTLSALYERSAPGAVCVAEAPNGGHWATVRDLIRDAPGVSVMDPEAWLPRPLYTRAALIALFKKAGWTVLEVTGRDAGDTPPQGAEPALDALAAALGIDPATARDRSRATGWLVRAIKGPPPPDLTVAAIGLRKNAGVTEARIDYPLSALATLPGARVTWDEATVSIPREWPPGVLIMHRQFLNGGGIIGVIERMIERGWIIVSDMDDDPDYWPQFPASNYHAYRGVHAVTVSTEPLARLIRQWNPHVQVFPNAVRTLPPLPPRTPKHGERVRVFFGALNRANDWPMLIGAVEQAIERLADRVEFVVVHDQGFHDALPARVKKEFHPTLAHDAYMTLLASCDIAVLPLADTAFNHLKSDLKFIECCAAGVVPICSPVLYDQRPEHLEIGVFARTAGEWRDALVRLCSDPDELRRRRALGLDYVSRTRMHAQQAPERWRYYRSLLDDREALEAARRERLRNHPAPT
jgi:hypothetical protein